MIEFCLCLFLFIGAIDLAVIFAILQIILKRLYRDEVVSLD